MPITNTIEDKTSCSNVEWVDAIESSVKRLSPIGLRPEDLGNPVFQKRYGCKWNYFAGSMYRGISSEGFVISMSKARLLSFYGSAGFNAEELEPRIQHLQSGLGADAPYGMCLLADLNDPEEEMRQAGLFIKYRVPVIEAAAYSDLTLPLVYCRLKGIYQKAGRIVRPRRIIAKCSRLEVARRFLSPPPKDMVNQLLASGAINKEEAELSQHIPMADDLAVEADSGGHTDQGVAFALIPAVISLKEEKMKQYPYREPIMIGCGGGIGTPESAASAFMLGADFIFTGSINQCTVESGAADAVKEILNRVSLHDTTVTIAGDMFEIGAKAQVVKKYTRFSTRANRLYQLSKQFNSLDAIPAAVRHEIETQYFKRTFAQVWERVCEYKNRKNPNQIREAQENPRLKMILIFKWYFAHCNKVTLRGDETERDNFLIYCGPALGSFNQWVRGTPYESWKNRHVDKVTELLMSSACETIKTRRFFGDVNPERDSAAIDLPVNRNKAKGKLQTPFDDDAAIAVIGMAGQFPKADSLAEFWENIADGKDCISEIPGSRWSLNAYYDPDPKAPGKTHCKWMGVLEDADKFDPLFFNISPAEAELMDPQQRLFLQNCWSCIENAGLSPAVISGSRCGVFVGCGTNDYGKSVTSGSLNAQVLMGAATSILSARISYLLNLKGPCLAIETACSSSLVAIAEACNSLILGTSDIALAGGVNVQPGPSMHLMTSKAGMLSKDGRCFTFDNRANGFVTGEGVGVILLKRLADAVSDRDIIHGVIRGWGINQDGKTNGITAPSAASQVRLEKEVYDRFHIDPSTISLAEAHGTGTKLGDPIEVEALTEAFRGYTEKKNYCALGSVKSNIGHLLTAAGIAGVLKVLLSIQKKMLPPTVHFEKLNEHITIDNSPFYINDKLREWESAAGVPRCACVSSFGFSGTNAHIVIEEYPYKKDAAETINRVSSDNPALFVLSAKSEERLKNYALKMKRWIETRKELNPADIAYTLQTGRDAMDCRLAFLADSRRTLLEMLEGLISGKAPSGMLTAQVKPSEMKKDNGAQALLQTLIGHKKLKRIAELWVDGTDIDWEMLYDDIKPRRVNLPTYPFLRERYWLPLSPIESSEGTMAAAPDAPIHPLLHRNTSDFSAHRFSSLFTGEEFFIKNHVIKGRKVLPGAAYLEMVRVALEQAAGAVPECESGIRLENIAWYRPVVLNHHPVQVHLELYPENDKKIAYEIFSDSEEAEPDSIVHSQGNATLCLIKKSPTMNIEALKAECKQNSLTADQCYEAFKAMGIEYGPDHKGIETLYLGADKVLARIRIPDSIAHTLDLYVLHPSIMDSALQASIGLMQASGKDITSAAAMKALLPFALEQMEIFGRCTTAMWALIRLSDGGESSDRIQKLDVDLCDEKGNVRARIKGFTSRVLGNEADLTGSEASRGMLMIKPVWQERSVGKKPHAPAYARHLVVLCEPEGVSREIIESGMIDVDCLVIQSSHHNIDVRFRACAASVFEEIKEIIQTRPKEDILVQILAATSGEQKVFAGLSGLLKTARLENPKIIGQLIEIEAWDDTEGIIAKLEENCRSPLDQQILYRDGKRHVAGLETMEGLQENDKIPWTDRGVYLLTGGAGGLAMIFAREIAQRAHAVSLVLTGRSRPDAAIQTKLQELEKLGARVEYRQVDVAHEQSVEVLIRHVKESYGGINGIIHCAGVIRDNFIIKKTVEEMQEVLAPKVTGLVNLDKASKDLNLEFFILFSSGAGVMGNVGQADYATANAFMDAYAGYRNGLAAVRECSGQTLSIDWPLWQEGGMQTDKETEKMMRQTTGVTAMQTSTGIKALYNGLTSKQDQVMVLEGETGRMLSALNGPEAGGEDAKPLEISVENKAQTSIEQDLLREKATNYLKTLLSSVIKLPAHRIDADAPLEKYGIDSILIMQLTNQLEKSFGVLSKTLFFEYRNIDELTGYFIESFRDQLIELLELEDKEPPSQRGQSHIATAPKPVKSDFAGRSRRRLPSRDVIYQPGNKTQDIAIIGISGRYPQAKNIREFWENLRDGKDCITEIPPERWNHDLYFDEDRNKLGKTYGKWGGFLEGVDRFDPLFFNISMREAEIIDPQERLFLECVYETIEDAGYTRDSLNLHRGPGAEGYVGVFVGVMYEEYQLYGAQEQILGRPLVLAGDSSSIANRVSYFCNFHGPSMAVNTMCSSSLTAIHLACQSIHRGDCDIALAGGVNLSIHPNKYLALGQGKFLSSKGRCESFGQAGDGYVPGEGVGAVLLKPLSRAVADHDQIYGVIKASAINHGGKTNGYAVPNPNAQATVIRRAIDRAGIDPGAIGYLEAHGTGTSLGDPIELAGLSKAFGRYRKNGQFCAIGSVKSNIGHCESAAGIAGVTKVLLQIKHGQLVPSLHSKVLNPNIDFSNSPFRVQQKLAEWKRPVIQMNGETKEYPRIAGISSFGAGGANAHIIIEEYIPRQSEREVIDVSTRKSALVLISAKNKERLKEQIRQLLAFIREQRVSDSSLADMAYTLQVGREAFEERVAVIANSVKELVDKLESFAEGQGHIEDLYCGEVMGDKGTISVFAADEDMQTTIDAWIDKGKYAKLLELWVKGLQVDWERLYGDAKPRRMSLPAYPFAGERYWMPKSETQSFSTHGASNAAIIAPIHPLLHQNSSDFTEQRYSSTFSGREFFLQDHVVKGRRVLPGVAYLEMARAGVAQAVREKDRAKGIRLKNVVWAHPLYVDEHPVRVHIGLSQGENGAVGYKVYSGAGQIDSKTMVHSQGDVEFCALGDLPNLDLKALLHECDRKVITGGQCYESLRAMGLEYGPGHRGISKIHVGPGQVLAKLSLPSVVGETKAQFVMHPSLMDSALQASVGLIANTGELPSDDIIGSVKPMLPFGLQQLDVFRECMPEMWAVVRYNGDRSSGNNVQKIDIDLSDPHGNVCIRMQGIALRELAGDAGASAAGTLLLESRWREQDIAPDTADSDFVRHIVMLCGLGEAHSEVESRLSGIRCLKIESGRNGIAERFQSCAEQVLEVIQKIFNDKPNGNVFLQMVVPDRGEGRLFSALGGILKTARLENPKFVGQLIEVSPDADSREISETIQANSRDPFQPQIRYRHGNRWVAGWKELEAAPEPVKIPWQNQGVYLITGGAGGLGMIFAREIADKTTAVNLVLTGRSPLNKEKKAELKRIEDLGARIEYRQVDVTQEEEVADLIHGMHRQFGKINGIIHSAGVIRDNYVLKKTRQELQAVLAPKVTGLVNLDKASRDLDIDLFILFSSVAGEMGNIGQADYAAANAFMDAFARHRNALAASGGCHGRTVSVNWPLWQEGGMYVDGPTERILKEKFGIMPMKTRAGMNALYQSLALDKERVMVLSGDVRRIMDLFMRPPDGPVTIKTDSKAVPVQGQDLLREKAHSLLKEMISSVSKVPVNRIRSGDPLVNYGIDSVMMTQMTDQLEKTFGSLPKTLFLEFPTIDALTGYFLESFHDRMAELIQGEEKTSGINAAGMSQPIKPGKKSGKQFRPASEPFDADENKGEVMLTYSELLEKADEMSEEEVDMSLTRLLEAEMSKLTEKEGPLSKADKVFQEEVGDYG